MDAVVDIINKYWCFAGPALSLTLTLLICLIYLTLDLWFGDREG